MLSDNIKDVKGFNWSVTFLLNTGNDLFLHGHNGRVNRVTRAEVVRAAKAWAKVLPARQAYQLAAGDEKLRSVLYKQLLPEYEHVVAGLS